MSQTVINEKSSLFLQFEFFDQSGDPVVPTTIDWRVDNTNDKSSPVEVIGWTAVPTPATSVNVQVPGTNNSISDDTKAFEDRTVTVRMDDGLSTMAHQHKRYHIRNLKAVS